MFKYFHFLIFQEINLKGQIYFCTKLLTLKNLFFFIVCNFEKLYYK